jgi:hypothetical protein
VPGRQFEVDLRGGDSADLDHVDDEVRAIESRTTIERRDDVDRPSETLRHLSGGARGDVQPLLVDVVQHQFLDGQHALSQAEALDKLGGVGAAAPDHRDFHRWPPFRPHPTVS